MQIIRAHFHSSQLQRIRPLAVALLAAGLAHAATITVPCSDSGGGTSGLIAAINTANSTSGANTINLTPGCVYELTAIYSGESANGLPPVTGNITINGYGATIERSHAAGTPNLRIFAVADSGDLTLNTAIVKGGKIYHNDLGSGRCADLGMPYSLDQGWGGGVCVEGTLTLNHSTVTGNTDINNSNHWAQGGGIYGAYRSTTTLNYSVVSDNLAIGNPLSAFPSFGGGIDNDGGALTLQGSTVTHNTVETLGGGSNSDVGGGIFSSPPFGKLSMHETVVSYNTAKTTGDGSLTQGGGIAAYAAIIDRCTIRDNVALAEGTGSYILAEGGGIWVSGAATVKDSVIFSNTATVGSSVNATAEGGGIDIDSVGAEIGAVTFVGTTVHCNTARALKGEALGGGIYNGTPNTASLDRSGVIENSAQGDGIANSLGGGIYNANTASGSVTLTDSKVKENHPNQCDPTGSVPGCSN